MSDLEKAAVSEALRERSMGKKIFQERICLMKMLLLYNFTHTKNSMGIKKIAIIISVRLFHNATSY